MTAKGELFSISEGKTTSLGAHVEFGKPSNDPDRQKVVPELVATKGENGVNVIGSYLWQGGNLGDLWEFQIETMQFILDFYKQEPENRES